MTNDIMLNDAQKKAVEDVNGAILVIAGAGSGKTRVLTARICYLVELGVLPYNILAITFTNKAAAEMKERIEKALGYGAASGVWTSTFHSMCAKILRIDGEKLGYTSDFSIYTEQESERVVKRVCLDVQGADVKKKSDYLWHISSAKTAGLSPDEYYKEIYGSVNDAQVIYSIYAAYEKELRAANSLDFDDLLLKTVQLFEDFPDVLEKYQERFQFVNVDEFQDTNGLQYKLVKMLCGKHGNIFVVGDEDQSIYGWRGAEIKNILDFPKDFKGAKTYKLEQNYRSSTDILNAANNVIKNNSARNAKTLWSDISGEHSVEYFEAYSDRDEAAYVSRQINWRVSKGASYRDMAVLVRVNSLTRLFEEDFNLHGIPYRVFGGYRYFERKEIKDALAYVRLAVNPSDNDSLLRVINYPTRGIGEKAVAELKAAAVNYNTTLFGALINSDNLSAATAKKLAPFLNVAEDIIANRKTMAPVEFMQFVIRRSGLEDFLKNSTDRDDQNRLENVQELVGAVQNFVNDNPELGIADFLQSVALISDADEMDNDNYVTVATVHAVKGLEFDTVFIVGLEEGIFPVSRAINNGDVEEERRLMYVAITRAKRHLYAINARQRFRFKEMAYSPKSRFVTEMQGGQASLRSSSDMYSEPQTPTRTNQRQPQTNSGFQRRFDTSTTYGAATSKPSGGNVDYSKYKKDVLVEHSKFGRGIIISTVGEGEDKTAAIAFKGLGVKRFSLAIAAGSLKIIDD